MRGLPRPERANGERLTPTTAHRRGQAGIFEGQILRGTRPVIGLLSGGGKAQKPVQNDIHHASRTLRVQRVAVRFFNAPAIFSPPD